MEVIDGDDIALLSTPPVSPISKKDCLAMIQGRPSPNLALPGACNEFEEVKVALQRTLSNKSNQAVAFQGMSPGEATAAMSSRDKGHLSHAQIQRRMTNTRQPRLW